MKNKTRILEHINNNKGMKNPNTADAHRADSTKITTQPISRGDTATTAFALVTTFNKDNNILVTAV